MNLPPSIYIARPINMSRCTFSAPESLYDLPPPPMRVDLVDGRVILDHLFRIQESLNLENIKAAGIQLGIVDYYSLKQLAESRCWAVDRIDGHFYMGDTRIYLDPMREQGPPVVLFSEGEAIKIMSMRRKK